MRSKLQHYWPLLLLVLVIVLAIIIIVSMNLVTAPKEEVLEEETVPLAPPPGSSYQVITPEFAEEISRDERVGQLLKKLPYQTQSFSLEYDYSENTFVYWYKEGRKEQADREFNQFLQSNGIENQSWLTNLVIQSE